MISVSTRGQDRESRRRDSNPQSPPYRRGALPLSYDGVALAGLEPASFHAKRPLGTTRFPSAASRPRNGASATLVAPHTLLLGPCASRRALSAAWSMEVAGHGRHFRGPVP